MVFSSGLGYKSQISASSLWSEDILRLIIPSKSELPKQNPDSFDSNNTLLTNALMIAEYEFYDTIRIKIGYDKGLSDLHTLKNHNL